MIFNTYSLKTISRALSITLGALLLSCACSHSGTTHNSVNHTLAAELFEEAEWRACRTECSRNLALHPTNATRLMHAVCGLRLGLDTKTELEKLCTPQSQNSQRRDAVSHAGPTNEARLHRDAKHCGQAKRKQLRPNGTPHPEVTAMANYELGRALWLEGDTTTAFKHLEQAFLKAPTTDIYHHAGGTLYILLQENPQLSEQSPQLKTILATCRKEWDSKLFNECRKPETNKHRIATAPARWLIHFYQKQISPAIGSRCSLQPSCSHYATQALKTHGLIGIGAMADRFIREPDVVKYRKNPVKINGNIKFSDPLSDHDWWMKK